MGGLIATLLSGFLIGSAARWIVPGPDPMPFFLTVGLGLLGSIAGGGIAAGVFGTKHVVTSSGHLFATLMLEIAIATVLLLAYRRFVQHRPLTGPQARGFPTRGVGIPRLRARLSQLGIDPENLTRPRTEQGEEPNTTSGDSGEPDELEALRDLHVKGILSDEEYETALRRLRSK